MCHRLLSVFNHVKVSYVAVSFQDTYIAIIALRHCILAFMVYLDFQALLTLLIYSRPMSVSSSIFGDSLMLDPFLTRLLSHSLRYYNAQEASIC